MNTGVFGARKINIPLYARFLFMNRSRKVHAYLIMLNCRKVLTQHAYLVQVGDFDIELGDGGGVSL